MALRHALIIAPLLLAISACETAQENPNYKYSSTYGTQAPQALAQNSRHPDQTQTAAPVRYVSTAPAQSSNIVQTSTQTVGPNGTYTRVNHECLDKERTRTLIGAGIGGSAGALAGNKLIGGTKGTLIGAAAGGVAGYGLGDVSVNCDPIPVQASTQQAIITPAYNPAGSVTTSPVIEPYPPVFASADTTQAYTPSLTEDAYSADTEGTPGYEALQQSQSLSAEAGSGYAVQSYEQQSYGSGGQYTSVPEQPLALAPAPPQIIVPAATPANLPEWPQSHTALSGNYTVKAGDTIYSLSRNLCTSVTSVQQMNQLDRDFSIQIGQILKLPTSEC